MGTIGATPQAPIGRPRSQLIQISRGVREVRDQLGKGKGGHLGCGAGLDGRTTSSLCPAPVGTCRASSALHPVRDGCLPVVTTRRALPKAPLLRAHSEIGGPHVRAGEIPDKLCGDDGIQLREGTARRRLGAGTRSLLLRARRAAATPRARRRGRLPLMAARRTSPHDDAIAVGAKRRERRIGIERLRSLKEDSRVRLVQQRLRFRPWHAPPPRAMMREDAGLAVKPTILLGRTLRPSGTSFRRR